MSRIHFSLPKRITDNGVAAITVVCGTVIILYALSLAGRGRLNGETTERIVVGTAGTMFAGAFALTRGGGGERSERDNPAPLSLDWEDSAGEMPPPSEGPSLYGGEPVQSGSPRFSVGQDRGWP